MPALGVTGITTTTSHLINKSLNKKKRKGGNIKINLSQSDVKKMNNILGKLSNMKLTNYKFISEQNGTGIFTSLLLPLIGSMIPSLLNKGSGVCCKKDNFFEKINNKSLYPISNFKINEILKNKNYIGTFSKNNVPKLENNQSTIVDLANSYLKGSHWIAMKFYNNKLYYFDCYGISYTPDVIRKQYPNSKIITNIYRIQSNSSNECGKF